MIPLSPSAHPGADLTQLAAVSLSPSRQGHLDQAGLRCGGSAVWRARKLAEARELLALEQVCRRVTLFMLDVTADLRARIGLCAPVPCLPDPAQPLVVASAALLELVYREEAVYQPQPGYSFVRVSHPRPLWLPNASFDPYQVICLGPVLPAGMPVKELLGLVFGALCLTTVTLDPADAAGTLNPAACEWWMQNRSRIPLSREPFLLPPDLLTDVSVTLRVLETAGRQTPNERAEP
jgi:hypothetical protein